MKNKIRITFLALLIFLGAGAVNVSAQITDDPILKACEETADKAKRLDIENTSLKAQLDIAKQQLSLKDERIFNKDEQIAFYKEKEKNSTGIDQTREFQILNLRNQIADDRLRIKDLESENKGLRRSRDFRTIAGFGAGLATGYFIRKP